MLNVNCHNQGSFVIPASPKIKPSVPNEPISNYYQYVPSELSGCSNASVVKYNGHSSDSKLKGQKAEDR